MQGRARARPRVRSLRRDDRRDRRVRPAGTLQLGGRVSRTATVVYGHTPVPQAEWLNRTINIDTGCVFGGTDGVALSGEGTGLGPRQQTYAQPRSRFFQRGGGAASAKQGADDVLDLADFGKRIVTTRLNLNVPIRERMRSRRWK